MGDTVIQTLDSLLDKWEPRLKTDETELNRLCSLMELKDIKTISEHQLKVCFILYKFYNILE